MPRYLAYIYQHNLSYNTHSFTPIIICRFTLDLRQAKPPGSAWVSSNQSASLHFVGNAGGSLRFGLGEDEEGEEDVVEHLSQVEGPSIPSAVGDDGEEPATVDVSRNA